MHRFYFPACPVKGPYEPPVQFGHMGTHGAVPRKCGSCQFLFEGSCTRFNDMVQRYMYLDFGPCGIDGPTDPIEYDDLYVHSKVEVPSKCVRCRFLFYDRILGFTCNKDTEKWGGIHRGLDWGTWSPDRIYLELPYPKITTKTLVDAAYSDDLVHFMTEHGRVNPGISQKEVREDYARLREIINKGSAQ